MSALNSVVYLWNTVVYWGSIKDNTCMLNTMQKCDSAKVQCQVSCMWCDFSTVTTFGKVLANKGLSSFMLSMKKIYRPPPPTSTPPKIKCFKFYAAPFLLGLCACCPVLPKFLLICMGPFCPNKTVSDITLGAWYSSALSSSDSGWWCCAQPIFLKWHGCKLTAKPSKIWPWCHWPWPARCSYMHNVPNHQQQCN